MNSLRLRSEFERVLKQYHVSTSAQAILAQVQSAFLVGPSSSGRNTIISELLKTGHYHYIVSDTTRQPRENNGVLEQNGREYWFRTEDELLQDLEQGTFLEAAIIHDQQVSGISIRELKVAADEGKIAINEIEVVGAGNIHAVKPDARFIFVLPPSFDEWMARMSLRGQLPADEVRRRLVSAVHEIETALRNDYYTFVVNDTFTHAAQRIDAMLQTGVVEEDQKQARTLAEKILADTQASLSTLD